MDYIKEKIPPIRDDRLAACQAYGGSFRDLSQTSKKGCLFSSKRTFSQSQGCQLNLSLAILSTIRDSVIIVHSPIGCGGSMIAQGGVAKNFQRLRDPRAVGLRWLNTNLDENDVINGGEKKLREAVLHAEREFRPSAIIVMNSCVPALIGDDVDSILEELQEQVSATIVPIHCEGFKTKIMATAYDAVYHGILRHLTGKERLLGKRDEERRDIFWNEEEELKERLKISRTVNVLNVSSMSRIDEAELIRLIKALDLDVRVLPCYAHPDDFADAYETALNVSICATHDDYYVEHIKTKYGIPFVLRTIPIGISNTNKWILDIAGFFGKEEAAKRLIDAETRELDRVLTPYRAALKGKTAFVTGGEIRIITTAELLHSLGLEILGLRGYHFDKYGEGLLEEYLDEIPADEKAVINIGTGQPFEQANLLARLKPDVYVGHPGGNGWAAKQGVPVFPLFGQTYDYMGYLGVFEVARRLTRFLKNTNLSKNLGEHAQLPYFESWYEEDPFKYIDDGLAQAITK